MPSASCSFFANDMAQRFKLTFKLNLKFNERAISDLRFYNPRSRRLALILSTSSSSTTMATRRAIDLAKTKFSLHFTYENAKTALFYYVLFTQSLKAKRHLRARGIPETFREFWRWLSQVHVVPTRTLHSLLIQLLANNFSRPSCPGRKEKSSGGNGQGQVGHREQTCAKRRRCCATSDSTSGRKVTRVDSGRDGQDGCPNGHTH